MLIDNFTLQSTLQRDLAFSSKPQRVELTMDFYGRIFRAQLSVSGRNCFPICQNNFILYNYRLERFASLKVEHCTLPQLAQSIPNHPGVSTPIIPCYEQYFYTNLLNDVIWIREGSTVKMSETFRDSDRRGMFDRGNRAQVQLLGM